MHSQNGAFILTHFLRGDWFRLRSMRYAAALSRKRPANIPGRREEQSFGILLEKTGKIFTVFFGAA